MLVPTAFPDHPRAQREPKIQPDRTGDDLRWKAVVLLAEGTGPYPRNYLANR